MKADRFPGLVDAVQVMNFTAYYDFMDELGTAWGESVDDKLQRWDCRIAEIRSRLKLKKDAYEKPVNLVAPSEFPGLLDAIKEMNRAEYEGLLVELEEVYHQARLAEIRAMKELEMKLLDPRLLKIAGSDKKH